MLKKQFLKPLCFLMLEKYVSANTFNKLKI